MTQIPTFGFVALTTSINKIITPKTFVRDLIFGKKVETHSTKTIRADIQVGNQKIAPFTARGKAAKVVNKLGKESSTFEPPNIKLKKYLDAEDLLFTRGTGMPILIPGQSGNPIQTARKRKIAEEQLDLRTMIERTEEYMSCKALSGGFTISEEDANFTIDYLFPSSHKPVLLGGNLWSAPTTANPLKDMNDWKRLIKSHAGLIGTIAVMNSVTFDEFIAVDEVQKYLDLKHVNIGDVKTDQNILNSGAERMARLNNVDYYAYDEEYDDGTGTMSKMIPDGKVALIAPRGDFRMHYGAIEDLKAGTTIGKYFSKDWISEDPSLYWLLAESHPIPMIHRPEAVVWASVL